MKPLTFSFTFLALSIAQIAYSQVIPDSLEIKTDAIFQEFTGNEGPGCAVAIMANGKCVFKKGYGMANLEHDIPISTETVFDIASLAKQFTGFAISSLIQDGKLSADDDIRTYLPFVPDFGKPITIDHLLHHTSGLRDWPGTLGTAGWRFYEDFSFQDIMRMVEHQKELDFDPGTSFSYSNTGYNLLAAIVERVSDQTFAQWVHEHIFKPLNMHTSQIREDHAVMIKNLADSYTKEGNSLKKIPDLLTAYGSSSLFTSMEDMIRWSLHFDEQVTRNNLVFIRMLEPGRLSSGDRIYYGFGLGLSKEGEPKRIAHSGWWAGFRSIMVHYPDKHLSIVLLSNSGNFNSRVYSDRIADMMSGLEFEPELPVFDMMHAANVTVDKDLEEKYVGTYQLDSHWYITISIENDRLMSRTNGEGPYPMIAKSDSTYWVDAYNNAIMFVKDSTGYLLKYKTVLSKRIIPVAMHPDQLTRYAGNYYCVELGTEYRIRVSDGRLRMYHIRFGDIALYPDPEEGTFGSEMGTFRFTKNAKQEITGFDLSRYRVRSIRFDKR